MRYELISESDFATMANEWTTRVHEFEYTKGYIAFASVIVSYWDKTVYIDEATLDVCPDYKDDRTEAFERLIADAQDADDAANEQAQESFLSDYYGGDGPRGCYGADDY